MKKAKPKRPKDARPQQSVSSAVGYELLSQLPAMNGETVLDIVLTKARTNPTGRTLTDVLAFAERSIDRGNKAHARLHNGRVENNAYRTDRAASWRQFVSDRARLAWASSGTSSRLNAEQMARKLIQEWRAEQDRLQSIGTRAFVDVLGLKISTVTRFLRPIRRECLARKNRR